MNTNYVLFDQIREALIKKGIDYWKAVESVQYIDNFISMDIAFRHLKTIPAEKHKQIADLIEHETDYSKKLTVIGMDELTFNSKKEEKLHQYLEILQSVKA